MTDQRIDKDLLGELNVPKDAYWGIHTQHAIHNFRISGRNANPSLIRALAHVKRACCLANTEIGHLSPTKSETIQKACLEISEGLLVDQFPVDALQGVAGTSTNMNLNEEYLNASPMIIMALLPLIGYEKATQFITEFSSGTEKNMRRFLEAKLGKERIDKIFAPYQLTALGYEDKK